MLIYIYLSRYRLLINKKGKKMEKINKLHEGMLEGGLVILNPQLSRSLFNDAGFNANNSDIRSLIDILSQVPSLLMRKRINNCEGLTNFIFGFDKDSEEGYESLMKEYGDELTVLEKYIINSLKRQYAEIVLDRFPELEEDEIKSIKSSKEFAEKNLKELAKNKDIFENIELSDKEFTSKTEGIFDSLLSSFFESSFGDKPNLDALKLIYKYGEETEIDVSSIKELEHAGKSYVLRYINASEMLLMDSEASETDSLIDNYINGLSIIDDMISPASLFELQEDQEIEKEFLNGETPLTLFESVAMGQFINYSSMNDSSTIINMIGSLQRLKSANSDKKYDEVIKKLEEVFFNSLKKANDHIKKIIESGDIFKSDKAKEIARINFVLNKEIDTDEGFTTIVDYTAHLLGNENISAKNKEILENFRETFNIGNENVEVEGKDSSDLKPKLYTLAELELRRKQAIEKANEGRSKNKKIIYTKLRRANLGTNTRDEGEEEDLFLSGGGDFILNAPLSGKEEENVEPESHATRNALIASIIGVLAIGGAIATTVLTGGATAPVVTAAISYLGTPIFYTIAATIPLIAGGVTGFLARTVTKVRERKREEFIHPYSLLRGNGQPSNRQDTRFVPSQHPNGRPLSIDLNKSRTQGFNDGHSRNIPSNEN
jgi:hypothetical protein